MTNRKLNPDQSRRSFSRLMAGAGSSALLAGGAGLSGLLSAGSSLAGAGYEELRAPISTRNNQKIEVLEFFWFGCPHCYAFEPVINAWKAKKPDYVEFVREAPPLNASWEYHARSFYAAEGLQITDGFFDAMFNTIHKDRKPMRDPKSIGKFVESLDLGVSKEKFTKAMDSFSVNAALKRSLQQAQRSGITGVPSIVINGKYRTGSTLAGGHEGILRVIDTLVEQEHQQS